MADRQKRTINDVDTEPTEDEVRPTKRRKARTSINHLAELCPGTLYHLVGQYGGPESPTYVMEITVDDKVFHGIGPSKKRAKLMAAEFALVHLGSITAVTDPVPEVSQEPYCYDDFTADINDSNSLLYYDFSQSERSRDEEESACAAGEVVKEKSGDEKNSFESKMIGKNTLTILRELHPNAFYNFVGTVTEDTRPRFIMAVNVDGQKFKGSGINKRLAKARAAREALRNLDKMEFGMAEDGMPVYEGDEMIWLSYKAELEAEAESKLENVFSDNPIQQLNEYFPDAKVTFPDTTERPDIESFFVCQVVVEDTTYEGSGLSKKDARNHASAVALNDLKEKGILEKKDVEFEVKRVEREDKKAKEKPKVKEVTERKAGGGGGFKTAVAKLNDGFQNLEYKLIAETPLKNTCLVAFTMAIHIRGKNYVGVGKNKKMAKLDVAEKALRDLGMWTEDDEAEKERMKKEEENLDVAVVVESATWGAMSGQPRSWGQGQVYIGGWGSGGGASNNWEGKNNQYAGGYGCGYNTGWGYGGGGGGGGSGGGYGPGMAAQPGGWGQVDPNAEVGYNAYPPIMQELNVIMGNMFESTFGQNPWKPNSDGGVGGQPQPGRGWGFDGRPGQGFQSTGNFSNRGNASGITQFGSTPTGLNQPPETSSAAMMTPFPSNPPPMTPPFPSSPAITTPLPSSVNSVAPSGDIPAVSSEPYRGRGSLSGRGTSRGGGSSRGKSENNSSTRGFSKYSNFRSAGFETGFKPSTPAQTTTQSDTPALLATPTYGPYGTPVAPPPPVAPQISQGQSVANFAKSSFPVGNVVTGAGSQMAGNTGSANNTTSMFQGSGGGFSVGGTGGLLQQGGYQSRPAADGYQASGTNNSGMQQYQDFMSSYQMTGSNEGFPPAGNSTGNFQMGNANTSGYSSTNYSAANYSSANYSSANYSSNYSSGLTGGYQSGSLDTSYSSQPTSVYGNQAAATTSVQSSGYQGNPSDYSMGNYNQGGNTTTRSGGYTAENFHGTTGDGSYSADSSAGYYGMYGGGGYNQGYNYDYSNTSGYDTTNTGYATGGYQNTMGTNSGYGTYGYSSVSGNSGATDSYSTATNKTTW